MTRVLLLGAGGMLGRALARSAPPDVELHALERSQLDVTDAAALRAAIAAASPRWVLNASAYTKVDESERDAEQAFRVNAAAVAELGAIARDVSASVVHVSTDYVFPGDAARPYREDDEPAPINRYGESKLAGERALLASGADALVVRTQWLFGREGRSFPATMWQRAGAALPSRVVGDQRGRPTYADDLAAAIWRLATTDARGIVHVANGGTASWYDVARAVYDAAGRPDLVSPCTSEEYPTPARRPRSSVLDTSRYESLSGGPLPDWRDALGRWLGQVRAGANATAPK